MGKKWLQTKMDAEYPHVHWYTQTAHVPLGSHTCISPIVFVSVCIDVNLVCVQAKVMDKRSNLAAHSVRITRYLTIVSRPLPTALKPIFYDTDAYKHFLPHQNILLNTTESQKVSPRPACARASEDAGFLWMRTVSYCCFNVLPSLTVTLKACNIWKKQKILL